MLAALLPPRDLLLRLGVLQPMFCTALQCAFGVTRDVECLQFEKCVFSGTRSQENTIRSAEMNMSEPPHWRKMGRTISGRNNCKSPKSVSLRHIPRLMTSPEPISYVPQGERAEIFASWPGGFTGIL
ncbi:hypothetical protein EDB84DRAFT_1524794 [Lactarius hengduanensis]|nr:hypothetical protein EDB84DRAFT_1524794 [Lactarius hengduanensis]